MVPKFEIVADAAGHFLFQLVDSHGKVLLKSAPQKGKVTIQNLVQHARKAVHGESHWKVHHSDNHFFMALQEDKHDLGRTPTVPSKEALQEIVTSIRQIASHASIVDHSKPRPAGTER
jgi:uncharacterized protein YegP (UPF0339 family)